MARILAVDIGTTHLKAGCFGWDGQLHRVAIRELPLAQDETGRAEHDPEILWDRLVATVREVVSEAPDEIRWIVLSAYQLSLMPVDATGRPLMGIMTLLDTRPQETFPGLLARMDSWRIYERTGCPPLFQYPLAKLEWLRVRRPDIFHQARWFVGAKDFLLFRLLGRFLTEPSLATATQLMNVHTLRWDPEILSLVELTEDRLPEVVPPETRMGPLRPEAAEALGLRPEAEVIVGVYDGGAVGLGLGAVAPGIGAMNLGTTAMIRLVADRPILDRFPQMRLQTYYLAGGRWFPGGAINNAGSVLQWLQEAVLGLAYAEQEALAEAVGRPTGLLFLPFLTGERYPGISHLASGVIFGLRAYHNQGHLTRAAMEGVAFALRLILEALRANDLPPLRLRAGGGGTRSALWMRILASAFQIPVEVPEIAEPALTGSAALARVAIGAAPDLWSAVREVPVRIYDPVPDWVPIYERQFERFQALMRDLEEAFRRHQEISGE